MPAATDPDIATAQTIAIMAGHVQAAAGDSAVQRCAQSAAAQFGRLGGPPEARALACAAWWWCKVYIKFVHHEFIIRQRLGEAGHLQGLISPEVLVRMKKPEGDCAIFSECLGAFLTVFGVPYEFVTVAVNPNEPEIFSHVYVYAVLPGGARLPLDASHGQYPGWQVPSAHVSRRQVWDAAGNPIADQGSRFDGLHNYGLAASGVDPETGEAWGSPDTLVAPDSSSADWAAFATQMGKMGLSLLQIKAIQPGTVVSADGAILRQNPGYAVGSPTMSANLGISTTTLVLGGLGLVAVALMFSGRKG